MAETSNLAPQTDPPFGNVQARVDEKGRLKLPARFLQYLNSFGNPRVFVTSLDNITARIYPISVWKQNLEFFENYTADPQAAEDIVFNANDLGADAEVDGQGRVLVPQELRQLLGIENHQVYLQCFKGRISLYSKEVYESRRGRAREGLLEKVAAAEKEGLK